MIKTRLQFLIFLLLLFIATKPAFAEVKAYLNQSSFFDGDPITLKIESSEKSRETPDLSPLQKDFDILGTSTSTQLNIMNGKRTFMKSWTIELQPNKKGNLFIPSIQIGKHKSKPLKLSITDLPPEVTAETSKHIFIEESVGNSNGSTFVQQQIPYTVKLFYDATVQTAQIYAPSLENAVLEKLGRDLRYKVVRAGKRFNVVEKRYVISPEKSGTLNIPAATVKGRIALSGGDSQKLRRRMDETDMLNNFFNDFRNDPFFKDTFNGSFFSNSSRGPSKPFTVSGKKIKVNVLPVPKAFTGSIWLPAENLVITDSWATKPPELKVGEPVTRMLTLQAKGLAGSQIPEISIPKTTNIKSYPEKAKTETRTDGSTIYGIQRIEISYIPDQKGEVIIPEIKVDWWDVKAKKQKTFALPEWNLNVAPGLTQPVENNSSSTNDEPVTPAVALDEDVSEAVNVTAEKPTEYWDEKLLIVTFVLVLLAILLYVFRKYFFKKQNALHEPNKKLSRNNIATLRSSLLQACKNNDKQRASKYLLLFAQAYWKDDSLQNLGMIKAALKKESDARIVKNLEQSLYSVESVTWQGAPLGAMVENGLLQKETIKHQNEDELTPLYPA